MARSPLSPRRRPVLVGALLILVGLVLALRLATAFGVGEGLVARLVSRALSTPTSTISIARVEGLFSSDVTVREITVADEEGTWLTVDRARILWKPLALFRLRLAIDALDVDRVDVLRKPVSHEDAESGREPFRLPQLPLDVEIAQLALTTVSTEAPVLGTPATFSARGHAHLGPSRGVDLALDVERQDRPGRLALRLDFTPETEALGASLHLEEPAGGLFAEIANLPDRPPVRVDFDGDGTLDSFRSTLALNAGPTIGAGGKLVIDRRGAARVLGFDLGAHVSGLLPESLVPIFAGETKLDGTLAFPDDAGISGPVEVETLRMASSTLSSEFKGSVGTDRVKGRLEAETRDLAPLGRLAGLALRGEARLGADIEGRPASRSIVATIDAAARELATGLAQIDGLSGGEALLTGRIGYDPEAGFQAAGLSLNGLHASATLDGVAGPKAVDLEASSVVPALAKADARLSGRAEAKAHITGTSERPTATLTAELSDGTLLGRSVPRLVLEASGTDLLGAFGVQARLDGTIGGKPAQGSVRIGRLATGETSLDPLDVRIGSVSVTGAGTIGPDYHIAGKLSVHGRDLDDLSPVVLEKLTGTLDADVTFSGAGGRQDLGLEAEGTKISGFGSGAEKLSAHLNVTDLYRRPLLSGSAEALEARVGGQPITRLRLDAKGGADGSDVTLAAVARGIDLEARGRLVPSDPVRIELSKFDARRGPARISLERAATITIEDGGADVRNLALITNGGRLSVEGRAGPKLDLTVTARSVPLSIAELVAPGLGLNGTLDGEAAVTGATGALSGTYRARLTNLVTDQTKSAGLPPIAAEARGRLEGAQAIVDATIAAGEAGRLTITGAAPLAAGGSLDLAAKGSVDLGVGARALAAAGRSITGSVTIDGRISGTLDRPKAAGTAELSNGSYRDFGSGTRLDGIRARLVAREDRITIENASATARNGGTITASGDVRLDPAAGFPGTLKIVGQRAEVVQSSVATAVVDLDLGLTGPLARSPRLGGRVGIETLDISIPDKLPGELRPLEGTRHIRPTPTARRRLALAAERTGGRGGASFDASLEVTVDVPGHIRVTGRGIDAELGGSVKVAGTLAEPKPIGAFHLLQGRMKILTSQLDFVRANLTFAGDLSPQLDFLATTQAGGASIRVAVTGNPSDPQFTFGSSPDYPQDEIISRLLFGQGSGRLTPTQALALTQAVAIYTGGTSALESLRRSLGLGDTSRSRNPLTNWLGDRVSLGIRTGATPAQTGVGMDVSIWNRLKARGAIDARGAASVGVGAEYEW